MKPLTLFEHQPKHFEWTERDWTVVDRINTALGTEVLRLGMKRGEKRIQAAQHVGVIRLRSRTIQVLPKIYQASETVDERHQAQSATANLLRMIAYAGELHVREHELASLLRQTDDWFEILTRLFATHLREEWQRGAHRTYQELEADLPVLKGKWRIADQLRRPTSREVFSVTYDEFTADNKLNRIFRYVVERLWQLTRDHDNRQILGELRQWMDDVILVPQVTLTDANPTQLTRLTERYRPLLNLARVFLDGGALQMAAGDLSTFAFVFDMNLLFEKFIAGFIHRHTSEILPETFRGYDFLPQSRGASRYLAKHKDTSVFQTKPDLAAVLTVLNERIALILDRDHQIGHSYFLKLEDVTALHFAWYNRVLPLMQEYFYNDTERLHAVLGDDFLVRRKINNLDGKLSELVDSESPRYEVKQLGPDELVSALSSFATKAHG